MFENFEFINEIVISFLPWDFDVFSHYYFIALSLSSFILLWVIYRTDNKSSRLLFDLGIVGKNQKLSTNRKQQYISLKGVKSLLLNRSYWRDNLEIFGNIFDCQFIDVQIMQNYFRPEVRLYFDLLPTFVP